MKPPLIKVSETLEKLANSFATPDLVKLLREHAETCRTAQRTMERSGLEKSPAVVAAPDRTLDCCGRRIVKGDLLLCLRGKHYERLVEGKYYLCLGYANGEIALEDHPQSYVGNRFRVIEGRRDLDET